MIWLLVKRFKGVFYIVSTDFWLPSIYFVSIWKIYAIIKIVYLWNSEKKKILFTYELFILLIFYSLFFNFFPFVFHKYFSYLFSVLFFPSCLMFQSFLFLTFFLSPVLFLLLFLHSFPFSIHSHCLTTNLLIILHYWLCPSKITCHTPVTCNILCNPNFQSFPLPQHQTLQKQNAFLHWHVALVSWGS